MSADEGPSDGEEPIADHVERVGSYRLKSVVAAGGGGVVYRAVGEDGATVAIKVLDQRIREEQTRARFEREAAIRIDHPNVVHIFDAGIDNGTPFIVMELLEGEPLSKRLKRGPLTPMEALDLGLQACSGLEVAHARGIVHRDLKPDNLFCCQDGTIKILDFGIALLDSDRTRMTTTGMVLGTPWYLAPEQARGDKILDARVDVWGLGAVLYEVLTGHTPFERENVLATVVAILREQLEPVRHAAPQVPSGLAFAIERCLVKDRELRWPTIQSLHRVLESVDATEEPSSPMLGVTGGLSLPAGEQRLVAVLLAVGTRDTGLLQRAVEAYGGTFLPLVGHRALGVFGGEAWEGDELERAAAAAMAADGSARRISVSAGRAKGRAGAIEGAVLQAAEDACLAGVDGVAVDGQSARGLTGRFSLTALKDGSIFKLVDRHPSTPLPPRRRTTTISVVPPDIIDVTVPGHALGATALVGRDAELAQMSSAARRCIEEQRAVAVAITGPIGIGKSRLRRAMEEMLLRDDEVRILVSRANPMGRGAGLSLLAGALRRLARAHTADHGAPRIDVEAPTEERRRAVRALAESAIENPALVDETAPFLGELLGIGMGDTTELAAARGDPQLMADRLRIALRDFFDGLCAQGPVALVIEDAQWADPASLEVAEELLERFADESFLLLLTAQPWMKEARPRFFEGADVVRIEPGGLVSRDVADLAAAVAGRPLNEALVKALTEHTQGNPLFVEQVVLELAEQGRLDTPPDWLPLPVTVEAAVQSRLDHLPPYEKDLCKKASILGRPFAADELDGLDVADARPLLDSLRRRGIVAGRAASRVGRARQYRFRSALMSDVAYNMIADDLRAELHRRAALSLARRPAPDDEEIAVHHERGEEPAKAAQRYASATLGAVRRADGETVLRCSDKSLVLGAPEAMLYDIHLARADAFQFFGRIKEQSDALDTALGLATDDATRACVLSERIGCEWRLGHPETAIETAAEAVDAARASGDTAILAVARGRQGVVLTYVGRLDEAGAAIAEEQALASSLGPHDQALAAAHRGQLAAALGGLDEQREAFSKAAELAAASGDVRRAASSEANVADIYNRVGGYAEAEAALTASLDKCRRVGHRLGEGYILANLGYSLAMQERLADARAALDRAQAVATAVGVARLQSMIDVYLARVATTGGDPRAAALAMEAGDAAQARGFLGYSATALALAASAHLRAGDTARALTLSASALELRDRLGGMEEDEAEVYLVRSEALRAAGDEAGARRVAELGRERLDRLATSIQDTELRRSFLEDVRAHRALLEAAGAPA